ncbi:MAG: TetR/AcrR family transcriptional regulator [Paracoccaceae bacterium]
MSEVAERLGVVEGAIYRIFPTKHQLVIAVTCDWYQEVMASYEAGLDEITGVHEQLRFVCKHHIDCIYYYPELVNVFFSSLRMSREYSGSDLLKFNRRYANRVIRILSEGALSGELRRDKSPKLGRDILFGAIEQATWGYRMGRADLDPAEVAGNIADLVYDAYACVPRSTGEGDDEIARQLVSISDQLRRLAEGRKS